MPDIPNQVSSGDNIPVSWFNNMRDLANNLFGSISGAGRLIYSNGLRSITSLAPPTTDSYLKYDTDENSIAWQSIGTGLGNHLYINNPRSEGVIVPDGSQVLILNEKFYDTGPITSYSFTPTPGSVFIQHPSSSNAYKILYSNNRNIYTRNLNEDWGSGSDGILLSGNPYLPPTSTTSFVTINISNYLFYLSITSAGVLYLKGANTNVFNNVTLTFPSVNINNTKSDIYVERNDSPYFYVVRKQLDDTDGSSFPPWQLYRFSKGTSSSPFTSVNVPTTPNAGPFDLEGPYDYEESGIKWASFTGSVYGSVLYLPYISYKNFDNNYERQLYIRAYSLVDGSVITDFEAPLHNNYPRGTQNFPTTIGLALLVSNEFYMISDNRYNKHFNDDFTTSELSYTDLTDRGLYAVGYLNEGDVFLSDGSTVTRQNNLVV